MNNVLEVYIFKGSSYCGGTVLLPATAYEILDALEKAGVTGENKEYNVEISSEKMPWLPQFISTNSNIYQLNELAKRLTALSDWQCDSFEGMVMRDAVKTEYAHIDLSRLINMTNSTEITQIAYSVFDDAALGRFYLENNFPIIPENTPTEIYEFLDFAALGKNARTAEGGVFTPKGYVVQSGEIAKTYKQNDALKQEKPDYAIMLEIKNQSKGENKATTLKLPATDIALKNAVKAIDAHHASDCSFDAIDCAVPSLTGYISCMLDTTEADCYGAVNELAEQIVKLQNKGKLTTYKAMLANHPCEIRLENLIDLAEKTEEFSLIQGAIYPEEYARHTLSKYCIDLSDVLFQSVNLKRYGEKLAEKNGVKFTDYGALYSMTGTTIEQIISPQMQGMEMR